MPLGPVLRSILGSALSPALGEGVGRRPGNNEVVALGDSRTAQNIQSTYSYGVTGNGASWARRLSAQRSDMPIANFMGVSGQTAAYIRANVYSTAKATSAKTLLLLLGINQGTSLAQDIDDITFMAQDWAASASDRIAVVYDEMPVSDADGKDATWKARHAALRDAIRALANPGAGVYVFPSWRIATGGDDSDTPITGYLPDGRHPSLPLSYALGRGLTDAIINPLLPSFDPYAAAVFATGVGLDGGNFAGTTGDAISVAGLTSGAVASSRMVVDGATTWAEMTLNTTVNASLNKSSASLPPEITVGTTLVSSIIKVKLHPGLTNCRQISLIQIKQSAGALGTNAGQDGQHPGSATEIGEIPISDDVYLTLRTPPVVVAADATQARWQLLITPERVGGVDQTMTGIVSVARSGMIIGG